jgi:5-methylcytosine-specific restriction enzyme subunit McrC
VKVPIENLYYLFCYAWRFIPAELAIDVGGVDCPDVLNLCGYVLIAGIDRLLRRGIDRGYHHRVEETTRVQGRIDIDVTMNRLTWLKAKVVCRYDDLNPDVLHNQILRTTVRGLALAPQVTLTLRERLHQLDQQLTGIRTIALTDSLFQRVQLHRNNGFYAFLMRVCQLVHLSLLPDRAGEGPSWFRDVLSDEKYMSAVFEEFIRNFYSLKQSKFAVARSQPKWNATAANPNDLQFLPRMKTDVTLSSPHRTIIIDAKYYRAALQTQYGAQTVQSANLYQIIAYLRGTTSKPEQSLEGMLIYPVGDQTVDLRFIIEGYPVAVYTLNLDQPWSSIEIDLLERVGAAVHNTALTANGTS